MRGFITTFQLISSVRAVPKPVTPVLTGHTLPVTAGPEPGRTGGAALNLVRHVWALRGPVTPVDSRDAVPGLTPPLSLRTEGGRAGELIRAIGALSEAVTAGAGAGPRQAEVVVAQELPGPRAELGTTAGLV